MPPVPGVRFFVKRQNGAIALVLLIGVALGTALSLLVHQLNGTRLQLERERHNAAILAQAKEAVLGYALANQDMPGGLPYPDRKEVHTPDYDGNGDCVTSTFKNIYALGKFPYLMEKSCFPFVRAFDIKPLAANGEVLWYAASSNLLRVSGSFKLGTNINQLLTSGNWLTVVNEQGTVLSNQVAFVLIAPGDVLAGQNRSGLAPDPINFLDSLTVGAITHSNSDASDLSFIASRPVNDGVNRFNDRLIYVTRTEFMNRLLERIVNEIRTSLDRYHAVAGHYPDGAITMDGECVAGTTAGFVPVTDADADCGAALAALPLWWSKHKWNEVSFYGHDPALPGQYTIQFSGCPGSLFTTTWNPAMNRGEIGRSGPCW